MNKKVLTSLVVSGTLIAFASCYKNDRKDPTYTSISDAFASFAPTSKTVDMDAATGGSFRGNSGARYEFPANAFVTSAGSSVTGKVKIEVKEYLSKSDMLFSGVLPMTDTGLLISGGEVYVHATQDGHELFLRPGTTYAVNLPQNGSPDASMKLFHGAVGTVGVIWRPAPDSVAAIIINGDTIRMFNDSLEYGNADKFMDHPNYQRFEINLTTSDGAIIPVDFNDNTVAARCLYDQFNGIYKMNYSGNNKITVEHIPDIPVHFVITALIDGRFYGGILGVTPTTGSAYNFVLKPTTPSAFKTLIDAL